MTRWSNTVLFGLGTFILAILYFAYGCEHTDDKTVSLPPPLGDVEFHSFSLLQWITSPTQEVKIRLKQQSDIKQLLDLRVFGNFQPEMTDEDAVAQFGEPVQRWTDNFGGTWAKYSTPLGYVQIGRDRRTSPTDDNDQKGPVPGRRSLQAYTDRAPSEVFSSPFLDVFKRAEKIAPRAEDREFSIFDSANHLLLDAWVRNGRLDRLELFEHVKR
jgi:hypothetical protein